MIALLPIAEHKSLDKWVGTPKDDDHHNFIVG
jgi:hypothetical protein